MSCQGCVKAVREALAPVPGVASVDVNLDEQTVLVRGSASADALLLALEGSKRRARLIGQGLAEGALLLPSYCQPLRLWVPLQETNLKP